MWSEKPQISFDLKTTPSLIFFWLELCMLTRSRAVKRHNDGGWMHYNGCLLVAALGKVV